MSATRKRGGSSGGDFVVVILVIIALWFITDGGNRPITIDPTTAPTNTSTVAPTTTLDPSVRTAIDSVRVTPPEYKPRKPYSKDVRTSNQDGFGTAWKDTDRNGCDTRNDILKARLVDVVMKNSDCVVGSGVLPYDPYTGQTNVTWTKDRAASLQIDHIHPLGYVWNNGADQWSQEKREQYANDPAILVLANGPENGAKSDRGPSEWMVPKNPAHKCQYVGQLVTVATTYDISLRQADIDAMRKVLETC